jgi:hypothetical protein
MWTRGVILLLALTAVLAFDRDRAKERITRHRIQSQHLHINDLEKELHELEESFDKLSHPVESSEINRVKARLRRLGVNNCEKNEVSCGGDHPQCVHKLLVCDGIQDCLNGNDEDKLVCDANVVHVGSTFKGIVHWTSCFEAHDHVSLITITASHRSSYFGPYAWVRATVTREVESDFVHRQQTSYTARGYFTFANRRLALVPDPDAPHRLGIVCDFKYGDSDHAFCRVVQEGSLHLCAKWKIARA